MTTTISLTLIAGGDGFESVIMLFDPGLVISSVRTPGDDGWSTTQSGNGFNSAQPSEAATFDSNEP